jgi:hypothetical protein
MRVKTMFLLLPAVLFVLVGEARADKSYQVRVTTAAKAGSVQLRPGEYHLVLDTSRILFRESVTGKEYPVEAKIDDSAEKKFETTAVHSRQKDGATLITKIELGGTKTTVAFP